MSGMVTWRGDPGTTSLRGPTLADFDFEIIADAVPNITAPATTVEVTEDDRIYEETDPGAFEDNRQLSPSLITGFGNGAKFASLDETIATVDGDGLVTQVSNATVGILVKFPLLTRRVDLALDNTLESAKIQIDWTAGSWGEDIADRVDNRLVGKTASEALKVFSTENGATKNFVRSTACWLHGLDVTCVSPWNDETGNGRMAGTLVTPRHVLFAAHYFPALGTKLLFVEADGSVHERTLVKTVIHPEYNSGSAYPDFTIGLLDSDLPIGITPATVLPDTWASHVTKFGYRLPTVCLDQESKALVTDVYRADEPSQTYRRTHLIEPKAADRLGFHEKKISGDSGSPVLFLPSGAPILLAVLTSPTMGTAATAFKADLNQMIADADTLAGVSTGYTLTEADLSGSPSYP